MRDVLSAIAAILPSEKAVDCRNASQTPEKSLSRLVLVVTRRGNRALPTTMTPYPSPEIYPLSGLVYGLILKAGLTTDPHAQNPPRRRR